MRLSGAGDPNIVINDDARHGALAEPRHVRQSCAVSVGPESPLDRGSYSLNEGVHSIVPERSATCHN